MRSKGTEMPTWKVVLLYLVLLIVVLPLLALLAQRLISPG
jgi:uncharacterized membrane protein YhaH (DUF805 family)